MKAYQFTRNTASNDLASAANTYQGRPPRRYKLRVVILAALLAAAITAAYCKHRFNGCVMVKDIDAVIAQKLRNDDGVLVNPMTGR